MFQSYAFRLEEAVEAGKECNDFYQEQEDDLVRLAKLARDSADLREIRDKIEDAGQARFTACDDVAEFELKN